MAVALAVTGQPAAVSSAALACSRRVSNTTAGSYSGFDLWNQSALLPRIADLDLRAGRTGDAAAHLREGLQLAVRTGNRGDLLYGLCACGTLCAATGRPAEALTVWATYDALELREGIREPAWFVYRLEAQIREARQAVEPGQARAAEDRGAAMNWDAAAEYALLLAVSESQPPTAEPGLGRLSGQERELVILVAQGRANAQIAAQPSASVRAVSSRLDRIRDKTCCRRRADLTRLALAAGLI